MLINPVYIHGYGFSSKVFYKFKGIKIDLPYHGRSKINYINFFTLAEDIVRYMPSKHDLVGWSMGGSVALTITYRFPKKVNRVFIIGTTPFFRKAWDFKNIKAFIYMLRKEGEEGIRIFRKRAYGEFKDRIDLLPSIKLLEDYINLDLSPFLPYIKKEVLIIHGIGDRIVPVKEAFKLASLIPRSRLRIIPGGHFPIKHEKDLIC